LSLQGTIMLEDENFYLVAQPTPAVKTIYDAFGIEMPKKNVA
jgi:hypothetical protein